jgi:hypothetical protein
MNHYFAPIASRSFPHLNGLVLFQLMDTERRSSVLEIRYTNFVTQEIDGDHLYLEPIEQVIEKAQDIYGVNTASWRLLSPVEISAISQSLTGHR